MIMMVVLFGTWVIARWDRPLEARGGLWPRILAGAAAEAVCIARISAGRGSVAEGLLWAVMGGALLFACVTDGLICQVYHFTWWICLVAAALLWCHMKASPEGWNTDFSTLWKLFLYVGLQFLLADRIYGRADSYAFCVCALALVLLGGSAGSFVLHMLSAYGLLFAVQLVRGNIGKRGNLKRPVPFLPYITAGFWITAVMQC